MRAGPVPPSFHIKPLVAELPLGALRAEHQQILVGIEVGPPLVGRVLVVARLAAALGADGRMVVVGAGHALRSRRLLARRLPASSSFGYGRRSEDLCQKLAPGRLSACLTHSVRPMQRSLGALLVVLGCAIMVVQVRAIDTVWLPLTNSHGIHLSDFLGGVVVLAGIAALWTAPRR